MNSVATLALVVLAADQGVKWALGRAVRHRAASLGPLGRVQLVRSRVWLARAGVSRAVPILAIWTAAATALAIVSAWIPQAAPWSALLIGGSFSHAMESLIFGRVRINQVVAWAIAVSATIALVSLA